MREETYLRTREYARAEQVFQEGPEGGAQVELGPYPTQAFRPGGAPPCSRTGALQSFREAHRLALRTGDGELVVISSLKTFYLQQNDLNSALLAAEDGMRLLRRYAAAKKGPLSGAGGVSTRVPAIDLALLRLLGESAQDGASRGDSETCRQVLNQIGYEYLTVGDSQSPKLRWWKLSASAS